MGQGNTWKDLGFHNLLYCSINICRLFDDVFVQSIEAGNVERCHVPQPRNGSTESVVEHVPNTKHRPCFSKLVNHKACQMSITKEKRDKGGNIHSSSLPI